MAMRVGVEIPARLKGLDAEIRRRSRKMVEEVTDRTAQQARENVGHVGPLSQSITGEATGDFDGKVEATAPHAKAQEEGAYIVPRKGKMLKFRDSRTGQVVFTKGPVRIKPKRYMKKARAKTRAIISDAFRKHFNDLVD